MSTKYNSRPQNRTRTPKQYHRSINNLFDLSQSDIESCTNRSTSRRFHKSQSSNNIYFHHHQHHHYNNYYLQKQSTQQFTANNSHFCDIKKFLIYAILFLAAYWLLFMIMTISYHQAVISKQVNTNIPNPNQVDIDNFEYNHNPHIKH